MKLNTPQDISIRQARSLAALSDRRRLGVSRTSRVDAPTSKQAQSLRPTHSDEHADLMSNRVERSPKSIEPQWFNFDLIGSHGEIVGGGGIFASTLSGARRSATLLLAGRCAVRLWEEVADVEHSRSYAGPRDARSWPRRADQDPQ